MGDKPTVDTARREPKRRAKKPVRRPTPAEKTPQKPRKQVAKKRTRKRQSPEARLASLRNLAKAREARK